MHHKVKLTLFGFASIGLLSTPVTEAQTASPDRPVFEVASVKPAAPRVPGEILGNRGGPGTADPGQISYRRTTLTALITQAYGVKPRQIVAMPSWNAASFYDIAATIPAGTTKVQFKIMLQSLLAERFHLQLHHQAKEFDAYTLVVLKTGPKLKDWNPPGADAPKGFYDKDGFPNSPDGISAVLREGRILMAGAAQTSDLAGFIERETGNPVVDATGLIGKYDVKLAFSPAGLTGPLAGSGRGTPPSANPDAASDPAPSLFDAVEKQLGLKLEKTKTSLDVLVIDHVDQVPVGN